MAQSSLPSPLETACSVTQTLTCWFYLLDFQGKMFLFKLFTSYFCLHIELWVYAIPKELYTLHSLYSLYCLQFENSKAYRDPAGVINKRSDPGVRQQKSKIQQRENVSCTLLSFLAGQAWKQHALDMWIRMPHIYRSCLGILTAQHLYRTL